MIVWVTEDLGSTHAFLPCLFCGNICLFLCGLSTDQDRDTVITVCKCAFINSVGINLNIVQVYHIIFLLKERTTVINCYIYVILLLTKEGICLYLVTETRLAEKLGNFPKVFATLF